MSNPFRVTTVLCGDGERLPMLIDGDTGLPVFDVNIYALTILRSRNLAEESLRAYLIALMVLELFLLKNGIELERRLQNDQFLSISEIDALTHACRIHIDAYVEREALLKTDKKEVRTNVRSLKVFNLLMSDSSKKEKSLLGATVGTRLRVIADYLLWYGTRFASRINATSRRRILLTDIEKVSNSIKARIPPNGSRNTIGVREGLSPEEIARLWRILTPGVQENPWKSDFIQLRNQLIIYWLFSLGIRRGELLGIQIQDIDFERRIVRILRRPDNKKDPRKLQPNTKTYSRELPLNKTAIQLALSYLHNDRARYSCRTKHDFFIVAEDTGMPLSKGALAKLMRDIGDMHHAFNGLTAHVLRHTWNDKLSEKADAAGMSFDEEVRIREYAMGWKKGSNSAQVYTRRSTRLAAAKASLDNQVSLYREPVWQDEISDLNEQEQGGE